MPNLQLYRGETHEVCLIVAGSRCTSSKFPEIEKNKNFLGVSWHKQYIDYLIIYITHSSIRAVIKVISIIIRNWHGKNRKI